MREDRSNSQAAQATVLVMAAFIAANLLGLLRQMVINRTFGTSAVLDAYFAAFRVPDLLFHVVAGGALSS
ncbi:MAG: murein biosynthesis integral membrane protein MurJ, partial [Gammaproteobacteria bacterium]|nr:murein biosynthesis integral membrane protein MurJ [Gammaproteobacteria bacterium]